MFSACVLRMATQRRRNQRPTNSSVTNRSLTAKGRPIQGKHNKNGEIYEIDMGGAGTAVPWRLRFDR